MSVALVLHILSAVIWVGGMFFAHTILRPAAAGLLETPVRLELWRQTLRRFFLWVWMAIVLLLASGYWMIFGYYGGMDQVGWNVHLMQLLGIVMMLLFMHVFFAPYRRFRRAVDAGELEAAGKRLGQIRLLVGINLVLGLIVIAVAAGGPHL